MSKTTPNKDHDEKPERNPNDDAALVKSVQEGDLDAFDALVRKYQDRVYGTVYNMTSNHEDAGDLTQEVFIKAFHAIKSFKGHSSFFTWLYRIAVNKTINFIKSRKRRSSFSLNDLNLNLTSSQDLAPLISSKTPHGEMHLNELKIKLNEAMQRLSDTHRMVVTMHDVQGMSHEEISKIMKCNVGTVRSRLYYARQQLQGLLADFLDQNGEQP
ncbi:MAG: sigma-70 family RNA polymerase sigma factor [Verrucomicrobia bacterium]|nr:sigma-70 family RNA polymerase sigma factor [Verrucomicrobiota bacterium]MCF7709027.1 sigma-70 family RNA polymerase sigma factor [Verrucomicrobiota bacterium]